MRGLYPKILLLVTGGFFVVGMAILTVVYVIRSHEIEQEGLARAEMLNRMTFEAIYASMRQEGGQEDYQQVIKRLHELGPFTEVRIVEGDPVIRQFGQDLDELPRDELDRRGLAGQEVQEVRWQDGYRVLRYVTPLRVQAECQGCHQAQIGEINGIISTEISLREYEDTLRHDRNVLLLILGGGLLILGLLTFYALQGLVIHPLQVIRQGATAIAQGNLGHRLQVQTGDELEDLAGEFNHMTAQLQTSYADLERQVTERTQELAAFYAVAATVNASLNIEEIFELALDEILMVIGVEWGGIWMLKHSTWRLRAYQGLPPNCVAGEAGLSNGECLCQQAMASGQTRLVNNLRAAPEAVAPLCYNNKILALLAVPVKAREKVVGMIQVASNKPNAFSVQDETSLCVIGQQVGVAIETARLYTQIKTFNEELETRVERRTRQLQTAKETLAEQTQQLRRLLNKTISIQEEERGRIAQDIHDGVSQLILGTLYEIQAAKVCLSERPEAAREKLQVAQNILKQVKTEMRRIIYDLHPAMLSNSGLVSALEAYTSNYQAHTGVRCVLAASGPICRLTPERERAVYRIVQEALHNVAQHANTDQVWVKLTFTPETLYVTVKDNGRGFNRRVGQQASSSRLGLISMQERAQSVGGELENHSQPGRGTRVIARVPIGNHSGGKQDGTDPDSHR